MSDFQMEADLDQADHTVDVLSAENEAMMSALRQIAYFECYTRDGETPPHTMMMNVARKALGIDPV